MNRLFLDNELKRFLLEDLGHAEVAIHQRSALAVADIIAEAPGILCGGDLLLRTLAILAERPDDLDPFRPSYPDGAAFEAGATLLRMRVHPELLRHGIRTGLNLLQVLSGIATNTRRLCDTVAGTGCTLLDTRKTTPGFRAFERYAVRCGGGRNHRFNRTDGVIIKKEDIALDGGIADAVARARRQAGHLSGIEVEVEDFRELEAALAIPEVTHLMLDNMSVAQVRRAVRVVAGRKTLEASGVEVADLRAYADTGVPFISTSALVRHAKPLAMKMRIVG